MGIEYTFFLGRQPLLSATEALAFCAPFKPTITHATHKVLIVLTEQEIPLPSFSKLGGSDRVAHVIASFDSKPTIQAILDALSPTEGKFAVGLSTLGEQGYNRKFLLSLKKEAKQRGMKLRFIEPNTGRDHQLSSAQVLFNGLYREPNAELTVIKINNTFLLTRTVWVQDIQQYEKRDTSRPVRDAKVGMLPPKLAQTMVTLAALKSSPTATFYDPFCGLGTVLQEGALMGHPMVGSDSNPPMISASHKNLSALIPEATVDLFEHDVRSPFPDHIRGKIDGIVTEPFLGTPLTTPLPPDAAKTYLAELLPLYRAFFKNSADILKPGSPLLFVFPRIRTTTGWLAVPSSFIDEIAGFGYHLEHLVPAVLEPFYGPFDPTVLEYNRPDALVGRDIRLWTRI